MPKILRILLLALIALGVPGACARAADAPQLRSVQVSPSGNVLLARFGSGVAAVKAGASYSVGGGDPVALSDPMWDASSNSDWIWWPLGPKRVTLAIDDNTDATLTGTWTNKDGSNTAFEPGYYQFAGSQFSQSADPAAKATYKRELPAPGRYRLSAGIVWLWGPDRTAAQTYTVSDGQGVLDKFTVDMTKPPSWDRVDNLVRLHDLGRVTLRDTALTVVISNGASTGNLVTDVLFLESDPPPAVNPGDKVTFTAPAGTVTTAAGAVSAVEAQAVTLTTDADWFPFDPARKPTMEVGYNKTFDVYDYGSRTYADRFRSSTGWLPVSGTFNVDDQGHLTAVDGRVKALLWDALGAGDDMANWPNAPESGTAVFRFRNPLGATDPGCVLANDSGAPYTFGARQWNPIPGADGKYTLKVPYSRPAFVPLGQAKTPHAPMYTVAASLQTTKVITDVEAYIEEETPAGYTPLTNPIAIERYKGRNFGALRFLDSMNGNGPQTTEYADWPTHAAVSGRWWGNPGEQPTGKPPTLNIGLASIAPIDADDILRYCRKANFSGWIKATTAAPHGLVTGQRPDVRGPPDGLIFDSNVPDGTGKFYPVQLTANQCIVTGPTTLLIQVYFGRGGAPEVPGPPTLGAAHDLTGYSLRVNRDQVIPYADLLTFARECGVPPWVIVPHLMSDAGIAAMADASLAGVPAGTRIHVEYSNECWNNGFPQMQFFDSRQYYFTYLKSVGQSPPELSDPTGATKVDPRDWMECYCHYAANARRIFQGKFAAAGRGDDLRWVWGSQAGYANFPTWSICNYAFEHHIPFDGRDELTIDTYVNSIPAQTRQYAVDPTPAYDRLDPDGLIDVLGVAELLGGRDKVFAAHRKVLSGYDSYTNARFGDYFSAVKLTSYEGGITEAVGPTSDAGRRRIQLVHRTFRSPRIFRFDLARLQNLDVNCRCSLAVRYNGDKTDSLQGDVSWCEWALYNGPVGTGAAGENANPWDAWAHKAQTAGAMRAFASGTAPPPVKPVDPGKPVDPVTPAAGTIDVLAAEVEAATAELAKAQAAADAAWAPVAVKLGAAKARMAKASAALAAGLGKVGAGAAYRRDAKGEGMTVFLPDTAGTVKTLRPVPTTTAVPGK
jgi:hypothetical protein